jgi:hypothetical protein
MGVRRVVRARSEGVKLRVDLDGRGTRSAILASFRVGQHRFAAEFFPIDVAIHHAIE